jgi:hypothetical protein
MVLRVGVRRSSEFRVTAQRSTDWRVFSETTQQSCFPLWGYLTEWLRWWTRNPLGNSRVGSNPAVVAAYIFIFSTHDSDLFRLLDYISKAVYCLSPQLQIRFGSCRQERNLDCICICTNKWILVGVDILYLLSSTTYSSFLSSTVQLLN